MTTTTAATPEAPPLEAGKRLGKRLAIAELDKLFGERLSYRERMAGGPLWACWELTATPAARLRLMLWLATDPPRPWISPPAEEIAHRLRPNFFGDDALRDTTARVLASAPPPVVEYVLDRVAFLGLGSTLFGLACPPLPMELPWLVAIAANNGSGVGERDETAPVLVAHECAHCWLLLEPGGTLSESEVSAKLHTTSPGDVPEVERPAMRKRRERHNRREREADELAAAWGFSWPQNSPQSTERRMLR